MNRDTTLTKQGNRWHGKFMSMSCPCEVIMSGCSKNTAALGLKVTSNEAWRIEDKFSRFNHKSVVGEINSQAGETTLVDEETARLLDCAATLYTLSEGLFDITAGTLNKAWDFKRAKGIPKQKELDVLLPLIGWNKVDWQSPNLKLRAGMSLDFGGIGKEYAVDRCLDLLSREHISYTLVNLGGDVASNAPQADGSPWSVGVEQVGEGVEQTVIELEQGGIATSGDQRRFILHKGLRYSHVLNPKTGWPVEQAPKSVTTIASTASEAGMFSTLAMLAGKQAESFLEEHQVSYSIQR